MVLTMTIEIVQIYKDAEDVENPVTIFGVAGDALNVAVTAMM